MNPPGSPKEPIVLDANGEVLHDPHHHANEQRATPFRVVSFGNLGPLAKILLGLSIGLFFIFGIVFAGIALGVLVVTLISRSFSRSRK